jgi:hypothetical protein
MRQNGMNGFGTCPGVMPGMAQLQQYPVLPTGMPAGGTVAPVIPAAGIPAAPPGEQAPQTVQNILYTPGFLRTQIGKRVRVEFLIGTGTLIDRSGTLIGVGTSYILLRLVESDDIMFCDMYSIKFVTFLL